MKKVLVLLLSCLHFSAFAAGKVSSSFGADESEDLPPITPSQSSTSSSGNFVPPPPEKLLGAGRWSLGAQLPSGGAPTGTAATGLRYFISPQFATAVWFQYGYEKATKKTTQAFTLRMQDFYPTSPKVSMYWFGQGSAGQNSNADNDNKTLAGFAVGLGAEAFLIPEVSVALETGFAANILPSDSVTSSTFTSAFVIYLHF